MQPPARSPPAPKATSRAYSIDWGGHFECEQQPRRLEVAVPPPLELAPVPAEVQEQFGNTEILEEFIDVDDEGDDADLFEKREDLDLLT